MTSNLFEQLGAVSGFGGDSPFSSPVVQRDEYDEPMEVPQIILGGVTYEGDAPDMRLKAHRMRLPFVDTRANDEDVRKWMEDRRLGVGASEIAVLFGLSPWSTVKDMWREKVFGCDFDSGSELFHFGHEMEPLIASEFALRTGETVDHPSEMIIIGEKPHYRASLDRVVLQNGKPVAALELKNLNDGRFGEYRVGGPSIGYLLQLQYQMMCAGLDYGYLAVLFGGQRFAAWQVNASPTVQAEIAKRVDEFWMYVEQKVEPPDSLGIRQVSKGLGTTLELTEPEWESKMQQLERLRIQSTKIKKESDILKQQIKENLGDYQSAKAGSMTASVSVSSRKSVDMTKLKADHPQLVSQYTKETEVKSMRIRRSQ